MRKRKRRERERERDREGTSPIQLNVHRDEDKFAESEEEGGLVRAAMTVVVYSNTLVVRTHSSDHVVSCVCKDEVMDVCELDR